MKALHRLESIIFVCVLVCPTLCWLTLHGSDENLEKRKLAEFPSFELSDPASFVGGFEAWYSDHLPYKNAAVRAQNTLDYHLFHTTSNKKVIIGSDGWLFYASVSDGDPIADYKGISAYSDDELEQYKSLVEQAQANLAEQGVDFYLLFAPNKSTAYQQYMPQEIVRVKDSAKAQQLIAYLKDQGLSHCDYLDMLNDAAKTDDDLYYHVDTHWNLRGSYLGYEEFCRLAGASPVPLSATSVPHVGGDLAGMLNLVLDEPAYYEDSQGCYVRDQSLKKGEVALFHSTWEGADPRNALILGDSFRENFELHVAAGFARTASMARYTYSQKVLDSLPFKPDIVLVLAPERYASKPCEVIGKLTTASFNEKH